MKTLMVFAKHVFAVSADVTAHTAKALREKSSLLVDSARDVRLSFMTAWQETGMGEVVDGCAEAYRDADEVCDMLVNELKAAFLGKQPKSREYLRLEREIGEWLDLERPHLADEAKKDVVKFGALSLLRSGVELRHMDDEEIEELAEDFVDDLPRNNELSMKWQDSELASVMLKTIERMKLNGEARMGEPVGVSGE